MAAIVTVAKGDTTYKALCRGDGLFRREGDDIGEWHLYGGARYGVDFEGYVEESFPGSPFARMDVHGVEGIGEHRGKSLRDIAQKPLQIGHSLIASPVNSPRAKTLGINQGETAYLSGVVVKIEEVEDAKDPAEVL